MEKSAAQGSESRPQAQQPESVAMPDGQSAHEAISPESAHGDGIDISGKTVSALAEYGSFGVWVAWFWLAFGGGICYPAGANDYFQISVLIALACAAVAFFSMKFRNGRIARMWSTVAGTWVSAVLASAASTLLVAASVHESMLPAISCAASAVAGWSAAYLLQAMFLRYRKLSFDRSALVTLFSAVVAFFAYSVADTIPREGTMLVFVLLPICAGALLSIRQPTDSDEGAHSGCRSQSANPIVVALGLAFFFATISFVRGSGLRFERGNELFPVGSDGAMVALAVAVMVIFFLYLRGKKLTSLLRWCYIYAGLGTAFAVATITVTGAGNFVVRTLTSLAYLALFFVAWLCMLATREPDSEQSPSSATTSRMMGICATGATLGWGVRVLYGYFVPTTVDPTNLLLALGFIDLAFFLFVFSDRAFVAYIGGKPRRADAPAPEQAEQPRTFKMPFKMACARVGEEHGLGKREQEAFLLLAQGRDAEHIAEEMVVSYYTARAHVRNIYKKLGVHSKQEALDMIEDYRERNMVTQQDLDEAENGPAADK